MLDASPLGYVARTMKNACRGLLMLTLLIACSSTPDDDAAAPNDSNPEAAQTTSTTSSPPTTAANRPPVLEVTDTARADVGSTWSDAIIASDPDGDPVRVTVGEMPLGFFPTTTSRGLINGFEWRPPEPGQWMVELEVTDEQGLRTARQIVLIGRNPRNVDLLLSVGDGVAAGEGLDRGDLLRRNDCGRAEEEAYPRLAFDALRATGSLADEAQIVSVACNGMSAAKLHTEVMIATDAEGDELFDERTTFDWAIELNPTIITITVGAADLSIADPEELIELGVLDQEQLAERLAVFEDQLDAFTDVLVTHTDAHIALTTYANPTADDPHGIDDCEAECFADAMSMIFEQLNMAIRNVARLLPATRVSLIDFSGLLDGHRAGDPVGLDLFRSPAHCADSNEPDESWVSNVDCLNPNERGHRAMADVTATTLAALAAR